MSCFFLSMKIVVSTSVSLVRFDVTNLWLVPSTARSVIKFPLVRAVSRWEPRDLERIQFLDGFSSRFDGIDGWSTIALLERVRRSSVFLRNDVRCFSRDTYCFCSLGKWVHLFFCGSLPIFQLFRYRVASTLNVLWPVKWSVLKICYKLCILQFLFFHLLLRSYKVFFNTSSISLIARKYIQRTKFCLNETWKRL